MNPRKIITERENISDIDELKIHPSVTKVIEGPLNYVCFGFCNKPDYELTYEDWRELRGLMPTACTGTAITINGTCYLYSLSKRIYHVTSFKGGIFFYKNNMKIRLKYSIMIQKVHIKATQNMIDKWYKWGNNDGYINSISPIEFRDKEAEFYADFSSDISDTEDAIALLVMVLSHSKKRTKIDYIDI